MDIQFASEDDLRIFERGILDSIEQSALERAEALTRQAIHQSGSSELKEASASSEHGVRIRGWDVVCADLLEVDKRMRDDGKGEVKLARLSLVNREDGGRLIKDLMIERCFFRTEAVNADKRPDGAGVSPSDKCEKPVRLIGLDDLLVIQRRKCASGQMSERDVWSWRLNNVLSNLLLVISYQRAVDHHMREQALPVQVALLIEMHQALRPMEANIFDFGPQVRRYVGKLEHAAKPHPRAEAFLANRAKARGEGFQNTWARQFAELREIHRILRYFPFDRMRAQSHVAARWERRLFMMSFVGSDAPANKTSWRISRRELTRVMRNIAEARGVPDVKRTLDPVHTDQLHDTWLATARAADFKLGPGDTLFQNELATALLEGGARVEDRWKRATRYCE